MHLATLRPHTGTAEEMVRHGPRPSLPGVEHVMVRASDRRRIFRDDRDREELLRLLAELAHDRALVVYAWALMPNHFHLLVGMGQLSLGSAMDSLLAGYGASLDHRQGRVEQLFEKPYASIACEAGRHFIELVRYIHLNPLRGGIVRHVDELDDYPYSGHSALLGTVPRDWQSTYEVLERFGRSRGWARAAYRKFVCDGALLGS